MYFLKKKSHALMNCDGTWETMVPTFLSNINLCTFKLGSDEKAIEMDICLDGRNSLVSLVNRECLLKKVLTLLLCIACRGHYDPPSESEVMYYREIKRHIRCVIAYHETNRKLEGNHVQPL